MSGVLMTDDEIASNLLDIRESWWGWLLRAWCIIGAAVLITVLVVFVWPAQIGLAMIEKKKPEK